MKHISILAAAAALAFSHTAFAKDIPQGTVSFSGETSGGLSILNTEVDIADTEFETVTVNLQTRALYFVQENIGLGLGYSYSNINNEYDGGMLDGYETESTQLSFEPTILINHSLDDDSSLQFGAALVLISQEESESGYEDDTARGTGIKLAGIYQRFLTESVALSASASYASYSLDYDDSDLEFETSGITFGFGATIYLGN